MNEDKIHYIKDQGLYCTRYGPGRDYSEGYDYIHVYFKSLESIIIFLNKHGDSCF